MASLFAQILTYATIVTGIFWSIDRFVMKPAREKRIEVVRQQQVGDPNTSKSGQTLADMDSSPRWIKGIASYFPVLFFVFFVRSFVIEPFQIPSGSMMQTLLIGDFLTVKKYSYGLRNPLTNQVWIKTGEPKRGDIAVFKYPLNPSIDYIKRVVGLPGDKVIYNWETKELTVYPGCERWDLSCVSHQLKPEAIIYGSKKESDWISVENYSQNGKQHFYTIEEWPEEKSALGNAQYSVSHLLEQTEQFNANVHTILTDPTKKDSYQNYFKQVGQPVGTWIVPEGHYFVMGDDRDYSADSRYWGFVPEENLVGQANFIWMSFDKQPDEWPVGIRFKRIGFIE